MKGVNYLEVFPSSNLTSGMKMNGTVVKVYLD